MREPLLIGQAPGANTDPALPLYPLPKTSAGGRLAEIMGLRPHEYFSAFERINLLHQFPGKHKRDDKFPMRDAKIAARAIRPLLRGRTVILVGRNVAQAFELDLDFHTWHLDFEQVGTETPGLVQQIAVVPHTSGRNFWYNDPENMRAAREFWTDVLNRHVPDKTQLPNIFSRRIKQASLLKAQQELLSHDDSIIPRHPVHGGHAG